MVLKQLKKTMLGYASMHQIVSEWRRVERSYRAGWAATRHERGEHFAKQ